MLSNLLEWDRFAEERHENKGDRFLKGKSRLTLLMEYVVVDERALPVGAAAEYSIIFAFRVAPAPAPAPAPALPQDTDISVRSVGKKKYVDLIGRDS